MLSTELFLFCFPPSFEDFNFNEGFEEFFASNSWSTEAYVESDFPPKNLLAPDVDEYPYNIVFAIVLGESLDFFLLILPDAGRWLDTAIFPLFGLLLKEALLVLSFLLDLVK